MPVIPLVAALPHVNLSTTGKMILLATIGLGILVLSFFIFDYYFELKRKRALQRPPGFGRRESRGFFWNYYEDWKKRREFHRAWGRKRPSNRKT